jgi:hypothetical protein
MELSRLLAATALGVACLGLSGCFQTLASAILAPESLAVQGASGGLNALTSGSAGDITTLSNTAQDLDRIMSEYPDAINRPELSGMRDQLNQQSGAAPTPVSAPVQGSAQAEAALRAEHDRRVVLTAADQRPADALVLGRKVRTRRPGDQLQATIEPTLLDTWQPAAYAMGTWQVRVR